MTPSERRYLGNRNGNGGGNADVIDASNGRSSGVVEAGRRICPVCKSVCSVKEVVPIYVRARECLSTVESKTKTNPAEIETSIDTKEEDEGVTPTSYVYVDEDNDGDNNNDNIDENSRDAQAVPQIEIDGTSTGLRRRRTITQTTITTTTTTQTSDQSPPTTPSATQHLPTPSQPPLSSFHGNDTNSVPTRPPPPPPSETNNNNNTLGIHSLTETMTTSQARATAAALTIHQSLFQALIATTQQSNSPSRSSSHRNGIPSLHNRMNGSYSNNEDGLSEASVGHVHGRDVGDEGDVQDTEFLSRLLLMLGCFVVLCLLLF